MIALERPDVPDWLDVSRETADDLAAFARMIEKWNSAVNLVSRASLVDLWHRHVLDSAQFYMLMEPSARHWADLGSGGGFPGIVISLLARSTAPTLRVTLIEADQRKAAFLSQAVRNFHLNAEIVCNRIEAVASLQADIVTARALAPLSQLCGYAVRHVRPEGQAMFAKGQRWASEVADARQAWRFDVTAHGSRTDADAAILDLKGIVHV